MIQATVPTVGKIYTTNAFIDPLSCAKSNFFHFDHMNGKVVAKLFESIHLGVSIASSRVSTVAIKESR